MVAGDSEKTPLLIHLDGTLYDVADFAKKHPGGEKVLRRVAGGEVGAFMRGEERIMGVKHEHSSAAYDMLQKYDVTKEQKLDPILSSKVGVLGRVGCLGHNYWTWIHQPYEGSIRLFDSDLLESLTKTKWFVVPLFWIPVCLLFTVLSLGHLYQSYGLLGGAVVWGSSFAAGVLVWTLTEYLLHRFVFHWKPNPEVGWQLVLHFLLHGLHHKTPMDGDRLVFPPTPAIPIVLFFYMVYSSIFPWPLFCAFGSGKLFGYVGYDCIHYYLHHGSPRPTTDMHFKKVYHHNHHFKNYDIAFGISTQLWDYVFSTVGMGPL